MIISPHPQQSDGWFAEKIGLPSASCFEKIVTTTGARTKGREKDFGPREKYLDELAGEILSGRRAESFANKKMRDASDREPKARWVYGNNTGYEVYEVGLCWLDEQKKFVASPDGLIDPDGGFETKDAEPHVQVRRHRKGWSKADHFQQVQGGMYVCEREWWDLQSYCDGLPPIVMRYERDEKFIKILAEELDAFCFDLAMLVNKIRRAA